MLRALRDGAKSGILKFILFGFMVMAVFGLVLSDVGGFFRGGVPRNTVATIGDAKLTINEFDLMARRVLSQQGIDPQTAFELGFMDQILMSEINNNLLLRAADDLGIVISDRIAARQIDQIVTPLASETMTKREALNRIARSQGMTENQFVQAVRGEMANTVLRTSLQMGTAVPSPQEARDLYQAAQERRTVEAVLLPHDGITTYQEPTDEILLPFYQVARERYVIPETRTFTLAILTEEALEGEIGISEEELRSVYEMEQAAFTLPERRRTEQAVLPTEGQAQEVISQVRAGQNLRQAVQQVTGSDSAYTGADLYRRDDLTMAVADAIFEASAGEVAGPVRTALGHHVVIVQEIVPPAVQPFSEVRDALRRELLQDRTIDQMYVMANMLDDQLAAGIPLDEVAADMGLTLVELGPVRGDGSRPDDREGMAGFEQDAAYILQTAFDLEEGESAPVMELSGGRFATIRIDDVTPRTYTPFEDVRDDLARLWIADQQQLLNRQRAEDAVNRLQSGESTLAAIASEAGTTVQNISMSRADTPPAPLTAQGMNVFYNAALGDAVMASGQNGYIVGYVTDITLPDLAQVSAEDVRAAQTTARRNMQDELFSQYMEHLQNQHRVRINQEILRATYGASADTPFY